VVPLCKDNLLGGQRVLYDDVPNDEGHQIDDLLAWSCVCGWVWGGGWGAGVGMGRDQEYTDGGVDHTTHTHMHTHKHMHSHNKQVDGSRTICVLLRVFLSSKTLK
jgi:hypothetical protein